MRALVLLLLLAIAAELFARFKLGLGDPPLVQTHPQIEYLYRPSRTYKRFGNMIAFNRWSMRSDDFPEHKADPRELRVLVLGDSIVNGGAQTNETDLATEIIQRELPARVGRPVVVGNISAGSWGPPNLLAYVREFGLFQADVVIIVLSSHDSNDEPSFSALGVDFPTRTPWLALQEAITRYLPRYLPARAEPASAPAPSVADDAAGCASCPALGDLIRFASQAGARVAIAQHLERDENMDALKPGHEQIATTAKAADADVIQLGPSFAQARRAGEEPYRDHIHPNVLGQRVIARTLMDWIVAKTRDDSPATQP